MKQRPESTGKERTSRCVADRIALAFRGLAGQPARNAVNVGQVDGTPCTVRHDINHSRATRSTGEVRTGAVNRQGMVEDRRTSLELDRNRLECAFLTLVEDTFDALPLTERTRDRKEIPAVASRNVLQTAVLDRRLVECDETAHMGHGLAVGPIGVILVPCDAAALAGLLVEELVVQQTHAAAKDLRTRNHNAWMPDEIVKHRSEPPGSEGVKQ